jgi:lysophospholipase L1-like esterase
MRFRPLRLLAMLGLGCAGCTPLRAIRGPAAPGVTRVVVAGDSLVLRSDQEFALLARLRDVVERERPGVQLELVNAGANGDTIAQIRARLQQDVLALAPDVVVLYWDSDAADVENADEPPARADSLRAAYARDLAAVLEALAAVTPRVVVSGPTLMGELHHGQNPKDHVLDSYAEINHRLCHVHHATWVDTRRTAFRWLRRAGSPREAFGLLTLDGEHLNASGVALVAAELGTAVARALGTVPEAAPAPAR